MSGWDVVVVGAGTAGCVVASEAAERGLTVLVAEAGPDYGPRSSGRWPADLLEPWTLPAGHDWSLAEELPDGRSLPLQRGRVVGGSSAVNGCVATWGSWLDYDSWAAPEGLGGWSSGAMLPHLAAVTARLRVRRPAVAALTPFQSRCLDAAVEGGLAFTEDINDLHGGPGVGPVPNTVHAGVRYNAAFAFLDSARLRPGLTVLAGRQVDRLEIQGDRVTGVRAIGPAGAEILNADMVVLAAGAYGSPAILLRSGAGPPGPLRSLGIRPVAPLPGVGANLHDQPTAEVRFSGSAVLEDAMADWLAEHQVAEEPILAKVRSPAETGDFDLHIFPVAETPFEGRDWGWVLPVACLTPRSRGSLRLRSADPAAPPVISHAFLSDDAGHDVRVLAEGVAAVRELARARALREVLGVEISPGPAADELEPWLRRSHRHYWHPVGTCRMGPPADPLAVTGPDGRVRGLSNCFVADASVMPAVPRANTNLPTAAVARKIARAVFPGGQR